ncbi:glycosyltransferase family 4 protein [Paenibacillus sp. ISL-20]|uniref:glycosyltransferase family 4 protein n=1 Tax=Paenibacillus sp. ISL-20 TaxID=2819163 RepID=UPI001BEBB25B|nr:glycosyltransferase family 4 protein [Paenibacillus sp. ISL-20]MBT2764475.1 glycosyltransferase family 4 protein [Paenibacillus sp. ISL-20]
MKICFVTHKVKKGDGQGRVNYEVITEAVKERHDVIIISSELSEELRAHPQITWVKIGTSWIPTILLKYQWFALYSAIWIWTHQRGIDLVVVNGFITYARSDINCIHFVHSAWIRSTYHPFREQKNAKSLYQFIYNGLNALLERLALQQTRQIVAVSEQVKEELVQDAHIQAHRISVVSNGVDLNEFYPRTVNRADFNLAVERTYALFAGDLKSKRKNLDTVLAALANVEDIELIVLGYVEKSPYPQLAQELGISDRVHFLGYRQDVADMMSLADLFIFPSRYEPFSLVILEAMASGLPVITSNRCGAVELLSNQSAVIIEDPDDTSALIQALRDLSSDRELLELMARKAREDAQSNSWELMSSKYMQLFYKTSNLKFKTGNQA